MDVQEPRSPYAAAQGGYFCTNAHDPEQWRPLPTKQKYLQMTPQPMELPRQRIAPGYPLQTETPSKAHCGVSGEQRVDLEINDCEQTHMRPETGFRAKHIPIPPPTAPILSNQLAGNLEGPIPVY